MLALSSLLWMPSSSRNHNHTRETESPTFVGITPRLSSTFLFCSRVPRSMHSGQQSIKFDNQLAFSSPHITHYDVLGPLKSSNVDLNAFPSSEGESAQRRHPATPITKQRISYKDLASLCIRWSREVKLKVTGTKTDWNKRDKLEVEHNLSDITGTNIPTFCLRDRGRNPGAEMSVTLIVPMYMQGWIS